MELKGDEKIYYIYANALFYTENWDRQCKKSKGDSDDDDDDEVEKNGNRKQEKN